MKEKVLITIKYMAYCLVLIALAGTIFYLVADDNVEERLTKRYHFQPTKFLLKSSPEIIQRGRHLADIRGCVSCHGNDLSGKEFINEPGIGRVYASNLTTGKGGIGKNYTDLDWYNAIRHGIKKSRNALLFMPSNESAEMSIEDMVAIIAFCKNQPARDNVLPTNTVGPITKVLTYLDKMPLLSAEKIDHKFKPSLSASKETGIAQGKYLVSSCTGCHKANLKGGPAILPGMPAIPDITGSGKLKNTSLQEFENILKTGTTPQGKQINNEEMPWKMTAKYSKGEVESLFTYLKSLK